MGTLLAAHEPTMMNATGTRGPNHTEKRSPSAIGQAVPPYKKKEGPRHGTLPRATLGPNLHGACETPTTRPKEYNKGPPTRRIGLTLLGEPSD